MEKVIDSIELLRMIKNEELNEDDKIYYHIMEYDYELKKFVTVRKELFFGPDRTICMDKEFLDINKFKKLKFHIVFSDKIEEDEEIDIDSIEDVKLAENDADLDDILLHHEDRINELIKAVKQLNKKLEGK